MKLKQIIKIGIDILMTVALLLLMTYELLGTAVHEWIGTAMTVLWLAHHILNRKWYKNLFYGKYTAVRIVQIILNLLMLITMAGSMVSGVILSRHVFRILNITGGRSLARIIHMLCAYWGFILMSFHLGLHWSMVLGFVKRLRKNEKISVIPHIIAVCISGYGIYALWKRDIASYLLMKIQFAFFDVNESILLFLVDYLAVMGLFVVIGYYFIRIWKTVKKKWRKS